MTLETTSQLVGILANIAVIASILFVALQVRMGVQMLRDAAVRNHSEKLQSVSRMLAENAELAELWSRGSKAGLESLSDTERVRFINFCTYMFRTWEELHLQHSSGKMDDALYTANISIMRDIFHLRGANEGKGMRSPHQPLCLRDDPTHRPAQVSFWRHAEEPLRPLAAHQSAKPSRRRLERR